MFTDFLIYCILSNGEAIKYHEFISVVVIELSVRCLNTGPEDRLNYQVAKSFNNFRMGKNGNRKSLSIENSLK